MGAWYSWFWHSSLIKTGIHGLADGVVYALVYYLSFTGFVPIGHDSFIIWARKLFDTASEAFEIELLLLLQRGLSQRSATDLSIRTVLVGWGLGSLRISERGASRQVNKAMLSCSEIHLGLQEGLALEALGESVLLKPYISAVHFVPEESSLFLRTCFAYLAQHTFRSLTDCDSFSNTASTHASGLVTNHH